MKQTGKRMLGLLLAVALVFTLLPAVTLTVSADKYEHIYITGKADWLSAEWSLGTDEMDRVEENLYKKTFVNNDSDEVWFKFTNGTWDTCWGWDTGCALDVVHKASATGGNLYFSSISAASFTIWFDLRGSTPFFYVSAANDALLSYDVYFTPAEGVAGPLYFHEWNNYLSHDAWPGASMTAQANGSYKTTVTQYWDPSGIIFDGGSGQWQTNDITSFTVGAEIEIKDQSDNFKGTAVILPAGTVATVTSGTATTAYDDIDDALAAWTGTSTLKLYADYAIPNDDYIQLDSGNLTIDLNGFTVSSDIVFVVAGANLTVKDSSAGGNGQIFSGTAGIYAVDGTVAIEGGTLTGGYYGVFSDGGTSVTVSDGTVTGSVVGVGMNTGDLAIHGGTIVCTGSDADNSAVFFDNGGSFTMDGGTVFCANAEGIRLQSGAQAVISGGTVNAGVGDKPAIFVGNTDTTGAVTTSLTVDNAAVTVNSNGMAIATNGENPGAVAIDISAGTIVGAGTALYNPNRNATVDISGSAELVGGTGIVVKGGTVNISGGTITGDGPNAAANAQISGFDGTGDAIYVEDTYGSANKLYAPTVHITGGTFASDNAYAMRYFAEANADPAIAVGYIEATAGTFESAQQTSELNNSSLEDKIIISGGFYQGEPEKEDLAPGKVAVETTTPGVWTIVDSYVRFYSLSLKGDIGVNFLMDLGNTTPVGTTVTVAVNGTAVNTYNFEDLTKDANDYYKITATVNAKQMTDAITLTFKQGDTVLQSSTYSVAQYANRVIKNEGGEFDDLFDGTDKAEKLQKLQDLCKAMLVYGSKAQTQFNYNTDRLADAELAAADKTLADVTDALPAYPAFTGYGLTFASSSLVLETKTTHRLYFTGTAEANLKVKCGNTMLDIVAYNQDGYSCYVDIPNMAAKNVLKNYTVRFSTDDFATSTPLTVNAKMYVNNALNAGGSLPNTVKALYWYSTAADVYFSANSN